jgi:hypothetical protein
MIRTETVFILGAGASIPYGFPSGKTLVSEIIMTSRGTSLFSDLFPQDLRQDFSNALDLSFAPSIDDFLEKRPEFMQIGKFAISYQLIQKEDPRAISRDTKGNWYELLWHCMQAKVEDFANNKVSFITFNYDRSLEFFLQRSLMNYFGISKDKANKIINDIPIIHIHGMLGSFEEGQPFYRDYDPQISSDIIKTGAEMIRVFHEDYAEAGEIVRNAELLLQNAKKICFLGFGYHSVNIERIHLNQYSLGTSMFGTVYQMGGAEISRVCSILGGIHVDSYTHDCLSFLRHVFLPD